MTHTLVAQTQDHTSFGKRISFLVTYDPFLSLNVANRDDFHIGPTAMKMIGREIAAGVTGAVSVNPTMELGSRLM